MAEANESIPLATLPPIFSQLPPISVKLSDGNFFMWQQQVDVAVYGYDLEGFLTGDIDPPAKLILDSNGKSMVLNPAFVTWQRQDRRVAGWLPSSLSENALTLVVGLRSARDIWIALETNYASRSTAKVMQYRQKMQALKKDGLTMTEYLGKMRTYFDLLGSVGCRISEGEQVMHILGGLGQDYDPAVCAVTSRSDPWNIGDVSAFRLSFESRMESTRAHSINHHSIWFSISMDRKWISKTLATTSLSMEVEEALEEEIKEVALVEKVLAEEATKLFASCVRNLTILQLIVGIRAELHNLKFSSEEVLRHNNSNSRASSILQLT